MSAVYSFTIAGKLFGAENQVNQSFQFYHMTFCQLENKARFAVASHQKEATGV